MTQETQPSSVEPGPEQPSPHTSSTFPPEPTSLRETGLSRGLLIQLLAKTLLVAGELTELSAAQRLKLPYAVVKELLSTLCKDKYVEVKGSGDASGLLFRYTLTGLGLARAQDYLDVSQYVGPAPVTLSQFEAIVRRQSVRHLRIPRPVLERTLGNLVLSFRVRDQLGAAVNSGLPIFLYGESGNGKSAAAEAIGAMLEGEGGGDILFPYAIEVDDQIIEIYDPTIHTAAEIAEPENAVVGQAGLNPKDDPRWILCKRPTVFTGGELTLPMLDLLFNPISKYYAAPPQVKASGGVLIIDDFGRQHVQPQALLNRWIVPLEKRIDYLTLHTGKKFCIPFDTLVVFCTNIDPRRLTDEAFLRRMRNKIHVEDPTREAYTEIFKGCCEKHGVPYEPGAIEYLYQHYYAKYDVTPRGCHPRDLIEQILSIARFYDIAPKLETWFLDRACQSYLFLPAKGASTLASPK
jgi:hypothetical protein